MDLAAETINFPALAADTARGREQKTASQNGQRRALIDTVKARFSREAGYHGILNERLILWGVGGCEKRHIAYQAALELTTAHARKLLCVEARSFEGFIRDYQNAFITLTGSPLPHGLSCSSALAKVKHTLEQRRQEWLLVVFDLQYFMEEDDSGSSQSLTSFFPSRGQILMTTSCVIPRAPGLDKSFPEFQCGLDIAESSADLHIPELGDDELRAYDQGIVTTIFNNHKKGFGRYPRSECITPLFLRLTNANMQLLNLSAAQYRKFFKEEVSIGPQNEKRTNAAFHFTMKVMWNGLADYNKSALDLLAAISVVDRLNLPLDLVRKLPIFASGTSERLNPALELLVSLRLLYLDIARDGSATLNIHLTIYRWIRGKVRETYEEREFERFLTDWVSVLDDRLRLTDTSSDPWYDPEACWILAPHIWTLISAISLLATATPEIMTFLIKISNFLIYDGLLPNYAGIFISQAYAVGLSLRSAGSCDSVTLNQYFVQIKRIRAEAYLLVTKPVLAHSDLAGAKAAIARLPPGAGAAQAWRDVDDLEVQICIARERHADAERILDRLLNSPEPNVQEATVAQRHYYMAVALNLQEYTQDLNVLALQHSHATMVYWQALPEEKRWGQADIDVLRWVEKHASLLMGLSKYKGALLFLPRLFDIWIELVPECSSLVWRLAFCTVFCYAQLDKIVEVEKVACRILELSPIADLEGDCLTYALLMLHEVGVQYERYGRTVEAEGIFRFNLRTAQKREVMNLAGTGKFVSSHDRLQLMVCLYQQEKFYEVRAINRELEPDEGVEDSLEEALVIYHTMRTLYQRAVWAEQDESTVEFKALLDDRRIKPLLRGAVRRFGSVKKRIREGRDFESDIERHQVGMARKSRVLHLIDQNLVYLSFAGWSVGFGDDEGEQVWFNQSQRVLGEFWKWCDCRRKRTRSGSINPVNLIGKRHIRAAAEKETRRKEMKQRQITDWFQAVKQPITAPVEGCHAACPCIAANQAGLSEFAKRESTLWHWKEPGKGFAGSKTNRPRFRKMPPRRTPLPDNELFAKEDDGTWRWLQTELMARESDSESYIVPHALGMPTVVISPPEGSDEIMKIMKDGQVKITKFYDRDHAYSFTRVHKEEDGPTKAPTRLKDILEDEEEEISRLMPYVGEVSKEPIVRR